MIAPSRNSRRFFRSAYLVPLFCAGLNVVANFVSLLLRRLGLLRFGSLLRSLAGLLAGLAGRLRGLAGRFCGLGGLLGRLLALLRFLDLLGGLAFDATAGRLDRRARTLRRR